MNNDPTTRTARLVATLVAVPLALIAGFAVFQMLKPDPQSTGPVAMAAPPLEAGQVSYCRALLSQLPDAIRDRKQRPVTAGAEQNAAYGDPAITMACGGQLASFARTDQVWSMNGVCWHADATGTVWTTVDREVPVTVNVPKDYDGSGQWANAFSDPIAASIPNAPNVPSGCKS